MASANSQKHFSSLPDHVHVLYTRPPKTTTLRRAPRRLMPPPMLLLALPPAVVGLAARAAAHLALAGDGAVGADAAGHKEVRGDLDGLGDVGLE